MPSAKPSSSLIKRYLPVRLKIPCLNGNGSSDDTFFFVTEHQRTSNKEAGAATLFIANVPCVPGVHAKILLTSLLGRYGKVASVSVTENTRSEETSGPLANVSSSEPSFFRTICSEGKFAHVMFKSKNDMKKAMRALQGIVSGASNQPELCLDSSELRKLAAETKDLQTENADELTVQEDDDSQETELGGISAVAERWRRSRRALSRSALMEECNSVMESFEQAEEADRQSREAAGNEPDDDGFVTVTYAKQSTGKKRELEEGTADHGRRKVTKRSRRKKVVGSTELSDFYRFQMKESRMKSVHELRKKFEQDLAKVKQIQEDRQYKPF